MDIFHGRWEFQYQYCLVGYCRSRPTEGVDTLPGPITISYFEYMMFLEPGIGEFLGHIQVLASTHWWIMPRRLIVAQVGSIRAAIPSMETYNVNAWYMEIQTWPNLLIIVG
jgi:hypothetical protein